MQLLESEWMFINDIIYKFNSQKDLDSARCEFLDMVRIMIKCDSATFFLADKKKKFTIGNPVGSDFPENVLQEYIDLEMDRDYARWLFSTTQGHTYRTSEWFPPGEREKEPYYKSYYEKHNIHYAGLLTLAYHDRFMGIVCLYRNKTYDDFSDRDMFILDVLQKHLAFRVYHEWFEPDSVKEGVQGLVKKRLDEVSIQYGLTNREKEIVELLLSGKNSDEICNKLVIAAGTFKTHIVNLYKKLGINRRSELLKIFTVNDE